MNAFEYADHQVHQANSSKKHHKDDNKFAPLGKLRGDAQRQSGGAVGPKTFKGHLEQCKTGI